MADGTVKRELLIELKLAAASGNKAIASQFQRDLDRSTKTEVDAHRKAADEIGKIAAAAEAKRAGQLRNEVTQRKQAEDEKVKAAKQTADRVQALNEKMVNSQNQLLGATKQGLEGILQASQGFLQLGIVGEESLEKVVRQFVKLDASFKIIKGGIDIFLSLRTAVAAYNNTLSASVALQGLLGLSGRGAGGSAAATSAVAGASALTGATAAKTGLAGGPALGIIGASAVGGNFGLPYLANLLGRATGNGADFISTDPLHRQFLDLLDPQTGDAEFAASEQRRNNLFIPQAIQQAQARSQFRLDALTARQQQFGQLGAAGGLDERAIFRSQKLAAFQALDQAEAGGAQDASSGLVNRAIELESLREVLAIRTNIAELDRKNVQSLQSQLDTKQRLVESAQRELDISKKQVAAEEGKRDTSLARFGRLGKGEQNRLQSIAERVKQGGKLNRADAEFLESTGFGGKIAGDFFTEQGKNAGGLGVLDSLGELEGLKQARQDEAAALAEVNKARVEEQKAIVALADARKAELDSIKAVTDAFTRLNQETGVDIGVGGAQLNVGAQVVQNAFTNFTNQILAAIEQGRQELERRQQAQQGAGV